VHLHSLSEAELCGQQPATDAHSLRQVSVLKGHPGPAAHLRFTLPMKSIRSVWTVLSNAPTLASSGLAPSLVTATIVSTCFMQC